MRLVQVNYDNEEDIETITVTMSFKEAVALANIAGKLNGHAYNKLGLHGDDNLYNTIANVMNSQFDDGTPDLHINLKTLNDSPEAKREA